MGIWYNYKGEPTAGWSRPTDNRLRATKLRSANGTVLVSTVFLGIDHRITGNGPPILWETMVFDGGEVGMEEICQRYESAREAIDAHNLIVANAEAIGARVVTDHVNPELYDF